MKIAILTPSRERAYHLKKFIDSVIHNQSFNNHISFYNYIDQDDPTRERYSTILRPGHTIYNIIGKPQSVSKSWNILAQKAYTDKVDILIMGNDDLTYTTKNWDTLLENEIKKFSDQIYCMWFEDKRQGSKHCAFPIVSKKWYETLGYLTPGIFHFFYNDTWIFDIAKRINRTHFIPNVITPHVHLVNDKTYNRNRKTPQGHLANLDQVIFKNTEGERIKAAEKLMKVMQ